MDTKTFLRLDQILIDPTLEKLLPLEVAQQFHALPIASDGQQITVAIAEPENDSATAAVSAAIGKPAYFVQADSSQIDNRLNQMVLRSIQARHHILCCRSYASPAEDLNTYLDYITKQIEATIDHVNIPWHGKSSIQEIRQTSALFHPDLIVLQVNELLNSTREMNKAISHNLIQELPCSMLLPQTPSWPIDKILLVLPDSVPANDSAVDWTIEIAHSSKAAVNILPLLPPVPGIYGSMISHNLNDLAASNDPFSKMIRFVDQRFKESGIEATFTFRCGEPLSQLRQELSRIEPDLVVAAAQKGSRLNRLVSGDLVKSIINWSARPVLVVKP